MTLLKYTKLDAMVLIMYTLSVAVKTLMLFFYLCSGISKPSGHGIHYIKLFVIQIRVNLCLYTICVSRCTVVSTIE